MSSSTSSVSPRPRISTTVALTDEYIMKDGTSDNIEYRLTTNGGTKKQSDVQLKIDRPRGEKNEGERGP